MSKYISELLGAKEPMFSMAISQLESATGNPSADLRLSAEVIGKAHMKMRELGLDPKDTTGRELYHALLNLAKIHDSFLAKRLGVDDPEDVVALMPKMKVVVERLGIPKSAWVLKHSVARRLIKAHPPKNVMKILGHRSIDSMLKREPIGLVYGSLRFAESAAWMEKFLASYKKLKPSDFETRDIEIILLDHSKWAKVTEAFVRKKKHNLTHLKELGVILMLPMPIKKMHGACLTVFPLLLHYVNEIRMYSSFFKLQQVKPHFGDIIRETLIADPSHHAVVAGQHVHWRVIQRYFGKLGHEYHPEIFEPHVQPEDLHWRKAEEILYRLEPALHFWFDMDYVGIMFGSQPVCFNLMDVAVSYVNNFSFEERAIYHFRESLWNEVFSRYIGQPTLETQLLKQLDNQMLEPELLGMAARR